MSVALAAFAAAVAVVLLVGPRMARVADRLGDVTGMGGALFGAVFLALATDLPELALTTSASLTGTPRIAVGNLVGSAAAQLMLLGVVDMALRDRSLYQDIDERSTLGHCALMVSVLTVPLLFGSANLSVGWVSAGSLVLALVYLFGLWTIRSVGTEKYGASETGEVEAGDPEPAGSEPSGPLWRRFGVYALILGAAGVTLEWASESIGAALGMSETAAGALLAGLATPLPELVTAISAARAGALELAVGNLVGSSALDVALLSLADGFYTGGSIFDLLGPPEYTLIGVALAVISLFLVALARREPVTLLRTAPESFMMIAVYVGGVLVLVTAGR